MVLSNIIRVSQESSVSRQLGSGLTELPSRAARDLGKGSSGVETRLASSIQTAVCGCMTEVWWAIWRGFGEPWRMENAPIDSRV